MAWAQISLLGAARSQKMPWSWVADSVMCLAPTSTIQRSRLLVHLSAGVVMWLPSSCHCYCSTLPAWCSVDWVFSHRRMGLRLHFGVCKLRCSQNPDIKVASQDVGELWRFGTGHSTYLTSAAWVPLLLPGKDENQGHKYISLHGKPTPWILMGQLSVCGTLRPPYRL